MALTPHLLDLLARMPKADPRAPLEPCEGTLFQSVANGSLPPPSWEGPSEPTDLRRGGDLAHAAEAYFEGARALNIRRAELVFDPGSRAERPSELAAAFEGIFKAMDEARERFALSSGLILSIRRPAVGSPLSMSALLERCSPYLLDVAALELDASDPAAMEIISPTMARMMSRRDGSAPRLIARCGPEADPSDIARAIERMGADRVHRAVRAQENPRLFERVLSDRIPLTLCPLEEARLPSIGAIERHPLPSLLRRGALAAVASHRPVNKGGYLVDNLIAAFDALPLSELDARQLALNSFEASLAPEAEKKKSAEEVDAFFASMAEAQERGERSSSELPL